MARTSWMILVLLAGCAVPATPATPGAAGPTGVAPAVVTPGTTGTPIAEDPVGRVFLLDLSKGEWTAPAGVGDVVGGQLHKVLLGVDAVAPSVVLRIAQTDDEGEQELCVPTTELTGAFSDPHFDSAAAAWPIEVAGIELALADLELGGDFAVDAERIEGLSLAATSEAGPLFVEGLALPWLVDLAPVVPRTEADIAADPACP